MFKSKLSGLKEWQSIGQENLEYVRTRVKRRKKDAMEGAEDSDQEEWVEEQLATEGNVKDTAASP
jgi:hypothetical protein